MGKRKVALAASEAVIDKSLNDLFASSSGPVKAPTSTRYSALLPLKERKSIERGQVEVAEEEDDEELSELEEELSDNDSGEGSEQEEASDDSHEGEGDGMSEEDGSRPEDEVPEPKKKERKRKRKDDFEDLETKYLSKLADEDDEVPTEKRRKGTTGNAINEQDAAGNEDETPIIHESLLQKTEEHVDVDVEQANRTLFLGNVSIEAVNSKTAKKQLLAHLASPLSSLDAATGPHKVESFRFRSMAFAGGGLPKRAAFITKSLMTATTKSTNAYAVYSTPLAARAALKALNGTVILDRHLRADSVAHPTPTDHRRCVFVGNLGFVDDETVFDANAADKGDGKPAPKKRHKVPSDIEEGLWRTFGAQASRVESVRVPRDPKTRVGKGFAYVQFHDGNDVEAALLLEGKKFPPLLPRPLRVSRAKDPRKTALAMERTAKGRLEAAGAQDGGAGRPKSTKYKHKATPEQQSLAGRAGRLLGRAGAARKTRELRGDGQKHRQKLGANGEREERNGVDLSAIKTPEQIVFEGRRASAKDGKPKDLKFGKAKRSKRPIPQAKGRGARRAAEWRKKGADK